MIFIEPAYAVCPVCTIAVGSGLAVAELLGVDDLVAAIWISALIISSSLWMADKFKRIRLPWPKISWSIIFYLITLATLYFQGKVGNPFCRIWGIDKILLGLTIGLVSFLSGVGADQYLRKKNYNKGFFPLQKVVLPLGIILLISLIFQLFIC